MAEIRIYTVTGNGEYPPAPAKGHVLNGSVTIQLEDPSGATAQGQFTLDDGATWTDDPDATFTAATVKHMLVGTPVQYRFNITGYASDFKLSF